MIVSMIEPVGGHGGNEFYDFGLCEALGKYCDVSLYTCSETQLHEKYNLKTKTYRFYENIYGSSNIIARAYRYSLGVFKTIVHSKKTRANIAHVHIYHFAWRELLTILLCKLFCIKVVATIHDVESFSENTHKIFVSLKFIKFFPFIDKYIVHSRYALESLHAISYGITKKSSYIVPHGDTDFLYSSDLNKIDARDDLKIPADKKIILFFGQLKKVKGLDVLLDAFAVLVNKNETYHLVITGRPWKVDGQAIRDKIARLGIDHRVTLNMSYVKNEDVPAHFLAADLVVLPYLKIYSSGVLLRALDYGTPVVVSDLPPLTDIIHDGLNGRVFRSGDSENLATVIADIIDNQNLLQSYAAAGKKTIEDSYSWDAVAKSTMSIYKTI